MIAPPPTEGLGTWDLGLACATNSHTPTMEDDGAQGGAAGLRPEGRRWLQLHSDIQRPHPPGNSPAGSRRSRSSGWNPGCAVGGGGSLGVCKPPLVYESPPGKGFASVPRSRPRCVGPTLVSGLWPGCVGPAVCVAGVAVCGMGGRRRVVSPSASPVGCLWLVGCAVWGGPPAAN